MKLLLSVFLVFSITLSYSQNLNSVVKNENAAIELQKKIDTATSKAIQQFLFSINGGDSLLYSKNKDWIQGYLFELNNDLSNSTIFITRERLFTHLIDFSEGYGWAGKNMDSVFVSQNLTLLISIPFYEPLNKGDILETKSYSIQYHHYHEADIDTEVIYEKEEYITWNEITIE